MFLPNARIKELEGQLTAANESLTTVTTERDGLKTKVGELTTANEQCKTQYDTDQATIATVTGERDAAVKRADDAEAGVEAEVIRRCAAAGVPPVRRVDNPAGGEPKTDSTGKGRAAQTWGREFSSKQ